jgi:hypothetical protein
MVYPLLEEELIRYLYCIKIKTSTRKLDNKVSMFS